MTDRISEKYRLSPNSPGVYLMKDAGGKIIYVGKAENLKKRLSSYFVKKHNHDLKTAALIQKIKDFDIVITSSAHEAFILESNFIKEHNPKYNILLKDGKNYPLLRIDMNEKYPSIRKTRRIKKDNALYFGPYSSEYSVNRTLRQIWKIFKLRQCKDTNFKNRSRPCLNFQIKACVGLCCNPVSSDEYKKQVRDAVLFLKGKSRQVAQKLKALMMESSSGQEYEKAAQLRDSLFAIENIMEKQVVVSPDMEDRDVLAFACKGGKVLVTVMIVRSGCLVDTVHYPVEPGFKDIDEIFSAFLEQYYREFFFLPSSILLSRDIENREILEQSFTEKKGKKVSVKVPVRGDKKNLVRMALLNAVRELEKRLLKEKNEQASVLALKELLGMKGLPSRIECFDNSSLSGRDPVSSMAVFRDGKPDKSSYRKYIIKGVDFQDDYACMHQVLERRFSRDESETEYPDLLVVDGGRGQLGVAMAVLKDLSIEDRFMVAGLAKKREGEKSDKIYIPGRSNPLNTDRAGKAFYLLQRVRDEAHRFAVAFQRKRRRKRAEISVLDSVAGIGPKKKKMLLKHFRGISNMRKASVQEFTDLPGIPEKIARTLKEKINRTAFIDDKIF